MKYKQDELNNKPSKILANIFDLIDKKKIHFDIDDDSGDILIFDDVAMRYDHIKPKTE